MPVEMAIIAGRCSSTPAIKCPMSSDTSFGLIVSRRCEVSSILVVQTEVECVFHFQPGLR